MVCEYICFVRDREVCGSMYLSKSQSSPRCLVVARLNYSSDNISRLNFKNKIKIEIEPKILLNATVLKMQVGTSQRLKINVQFDNPFFPSYT